MEFVTDRTQANVTRLKRLQAIGWKNLTDSQKTEYLDYAAKGAYNYTDLNRVESAVAELAETYGLTLTTKTDWGVWDVPTRSDMERYLGNVVAIRNAYTGDLVLPELPTSMIGLTYDGANNIEEVLRLIYEELHGGSAAISDYIRSGEIFSGEVL